MFDPFRKRLDMTEHHGGGGLTAKLVPDPMDVEPIIRQHLSARHCLADAIDQDLAAAAGKAAEAGVFEPGQHLAQGQLELLREEVDLRRAKPVNVHRWEVGFDIAEEVFVPVERKLGMKPALHQDLVASERDGLADLPRRTSRSRT